ncbi:MAG TPA: circularly permuted type 2 ATP-grasp protein, partial [Acidimicrobiales bacterium]|nr:circularly permuted type 2 ATP-grasp protein [Acidimicrobiales bacterium]
PVDGSGGYGLVVGPVATKAELAETAEMIQRSPRSYIAQEFVELSTVPTKVGDRLVPRHVDLRPFAVNDGSSIWVAPGGLTRVALREGSSVVNSSQGGGSKDTWVLAPERAESHRLSVAEPSQPLEEQLPFPTLDPERGPTFAAAQQQQQQQQLRVRELPC